MSSRKPRVLLITLKTFSLTGGVEKVSLSIAHSLQQMHDADLIRFKLISLYDDNTDERYVKHKNFKGYAGRRGKGMLGTIRKGISCDIVILSHINLAPIGMAIKLASPSTRLILWSHGIEIWRPINRIKKTLLSRADEIVAVSRFTASEIKRMHGTGEKKIKIIPNALDPYFEIPDLTGQHSIARAKENSSRLKQLHGIKDNVKILIALTRLRGTEKNKNYDKVIELLGELKTEGTQAAYYILCGKYDEEEYRRISSVAAKAGMDQYVILPGFIRDEDLVSYYRMADAFVLPSTKEGFGIAFIEAQACGLPVLAGNLDGSTEAVRCDEAGILVNPNEDQELKEALKQLINTRFLNENKIQIQAQCLANFSFQNYNENIQELISEHIS